MCILVLQTCGLSKNTNLLIVGISNGSCAESVAGVQNIREYFTKAITLANIYNIKE